MTNIVPYKFEVVAVCHVIDDDGKVVAEQSVGQLTSDGSFRPATLFGVDGLVKWAEAFAAEIEKATEAG